MPSAASDTSSRVENMANWFNRSLGGTRSKKASKPSWPGAAPVGDPAGNAGIVPGHQVVEVGVDPLDRVPQDGDGEGPGGSGWSAAARCDRPKKYAPSARSLRLLETKLYRR